MMVAWLPCQLRARCCAAGSVLCWLSSWWAWWGAPRSPIRRPRATSRSRVRGRLDGNPVYDNVRAIVVSVDGETVFERYYGTSADGYWPAQSVTKSVVSTLIGIAVDQQ